jgi:hypothetical protein
MSRQLSLVPVLILAVLSPACSGRTTPARPNVEPEKSEPAPVSRPKAPASDGKATVSIPAAPPANPRITANQEAGVIRGIVRWSGTVPSLTLAARPDDLFVTVNGQKVSVQPTPRLQVDPESKGVANVAVWLLQAPAFPPGESVPAPPEPVRLTERGGNFVPHVLVTSQGAELQLGTNDDEADFQTFGAASVSVRLRRGQMRSLTLPRVGLVEVRSESHPWITPALVHVLKHGYHAVTDPGGRFRLPAVPPGEYEVMFWHEGWRPADPKNPAAIEPVLARARINLERDQGVSVEWLLSNP